MSKAPGQPPAAVEAAAASVVYRVFRERADDASSVAASTADGPRAYSTVWEITKDQPPVVLANLATSSSLAVDTAVLERWAAAATVDTASAAATDSWATMEISLVEGSWQNLRSAAHAAAPTNCGGYVAGRQWSDIGRAAAGDSDAINSQCASLPDIAIMPSPMGNTSGDQQQIQKLKHEQIERMITTTYTSKNKYQQPNTKHQT